MTIEALVPRQQLAELLGVDVRSLVNFVDEGMPKAKRGKYRLDTCVRWYIERQRTVVLPPTDIEEARRRKETALAEKAEIEVATLRDEVIPIEVHAQRLEIICARLASKVKGLDHWIADVQLATTEMQAKALLDRISDSLLTTLRSSAEELDDLDLDDYDPQGA